ncbi:hypothetical protein [Sanguibacter massiliensis]|uniref:hypothetical protein n=1 Tax=Sanguibacter massiliensis TaxID=1973217 RepID=UPI00101AE012|nr:hypothetical protein [Sanguibacter massiliensis]
MSWFDWLEQQIDDLNERAGERALNRELAASQKATLTSLAETSAARGDRDDAAHYRAEARASAAEERADQAEFEEEVGAELDELNSALADELSALDGMLAATLAVDDFFDLTTLEQVADHPPFKSVHSAPLAPPEPLVVGPEPVYVPPVARGLFGRKKRLERETLAAQEEWARVHGAWSQEVAALPGRQHAQLVAHAAADADRAARLAADEEVYRQQCVEREEAAARANAEVAALAEGLGRGEAAAVVEYLHLVFVAAGYPALWPSECGLVYDKQSRELRVDLRVPPPARIPGMRSFKYVRSSGQVQAVAQTQKERRDRYSSLLHQAALRLLHEVFESDRGGVIASVSLAVGAEYIDVATGQQKFAPLLAVGTSREEFLAIDLRHIEPLATLTHLGATVSKKPWDMQPIETSLGASLG